DDLAMDGHLSPTRVAELALVAEPRTLVTTHVYPALDPERVPELVREAGYAGPVLAARDGLRLAPCTRRARSGRSTGPAVHWSRAAGRATEASLSVRWENAGRHEVRRGRGRGPARRGGHRRAGVRSPADARKAADRGWARGQRRQGRQRPAGGAAGRAAGDPRHPALQAGLPGMAARTHRHRTVERDADRWERGRRHGRPVLRRVGGADPRCSGAPA